MNNKSKCIICKKSFKQKTINHKCCSDDCRKKYRNIHMADRFNRNLHLADTTVGSMNEIKVATDLISKEYDVFYSGCRVGEDLIIMKGNKMFAVEVTTAILRGNSNLSFVPHTNDYDILALVDQHGTIHYQPDLSAL